MPFANLVTQSFDCTLSGFYRLDKTLFDECLNGLPAYTNCLISGISPETGARELSYFIPQGVLFDKKALIELFYKPYRFELIFFDAVLNDIPVFSLPGSRSFRVYNMERLNELCDLIIHENRNAYLFGDTIVSATLEKVALYMLRDLSQYDQSLFDQFNQHFENERLLKILTYIHQNLKFEITLDNLADLVYLSADYISQFFKRCLGMSIQSYLIDQRVKMGLHYLVSTTDQISTISENTGFVDQAYFNRRFKMFYKINPLRLRKKYQLLFVSQAGVMMTWPKS